jgi:uncharacterized 2Fe-2S/4Fe-4S cluster protein (DUF4445 family)
LIHEDIVLTEIDVENLIRTKAAIYAGCKVLLQSVGVSFKDLDQVIIAGGFGRHLDLEKAIFIGLLPEIDIEKFLFVGNGSLLGARLLSFSKNLLREAERIALMMTNLELSNHPTFMNEFIAAMFLPTLIPLPFPGGGEALPDEKRISFGEDGRRAALSFTIAVSGKEEQEDHFAGMIIRHLLDKGKVRFWPWMRMQIRT